ncbi:hypothetical protein L798_05063 [Zootermopsis nevadensis]|uniref:Uncharacterized protein n=1 Tax=Zootermopsis nevadensis TaxID=136037 RepID=A0A067RBN4_ZOONE|nr:hypothetical protein L798_05063 [Zootermopsis nevadensis]
MNKELNFFHPCTITYGYILFGRKSSGWKFPHKKGPLFWRMEVVKLGKRPGKLFR